MQPITLLLLTLLPATTLAFFPIRQPQYVSAEDLQSQQKPLHDKTTVWCDRVPQCDDNNKKWCWTCMDYDINQGCEWKKYVLVDCKTKGAGAKKREAKVEV